MERHPAEPAPNGGGRPPAPWRRSVGVALTAAAALAAVAALGAPPTAAALVVGVRLPVTRMCANGGAA